MEVLILFGAGLFDKDDMQKFDLGVPFKNPKTKQSSCCKKVAVHREHFPKPKRYALMPETITLNYQLTKELWRLFFEAHYSCDRSLKLRYLWGVSCIVIGSLGFGGFYESWVVAGLLMATGFFAVLSKQVLVIKSLRSASQHPFFGKELTVAVSPEEISVLSGNAGYSQPWNNFVGYRRLEPGFLLYHDQNAFFFLPASATTAGHAKRIEQILEEAEVQKL